MDWQTILNTFLGALCGAMIPVLAFAFWLGGLAQQVKMIADRCMSREKDHCHHYERLNKHEVSLTNHETRLVSLEQWRAHEEA